MAIATGEIKTSEHSMIRRWAESRGGVPARVRGGGNGAIALRIAFPHQGDLDGEEDIERISWKEFFRAFDEQKLALELALSSDDGESEGEAEADGATVLTHQLVPRSRN